MINNLKLDEIRNAMDKVRGESDETHLNTVMFLEDFMSTYGYHYPEVHAQSLAGALSTTRSFVVDKFGGDEYRFRSAFIRYLTDFMNFSDANAATTTYTDLEKFIQYLITYAFDGKNGEYFKALASFAASMS